MASYRVTVEPESAGCAGIIGAVLLVLLLAIFVQCGSDSSTGGGNTQQGTQNPNYSAAGNNGGNTAVSKNYGYNGTSAESIEEEPDELLLFDLPIYYNENALIDRSDENDEIFDINGWKHTYFNYISCSGHGKDYDGYKKYVRYDLNGKYSKISGDLFAYNDGKTCWLEFYDGETFMFATPIIDDENPSCSVDFDITGVQYLTVYLCSDDPYWHGGWIISELTISK